MTTSTRDRFLKEIDRAMKTQGKDIPAEVVEHAIGIANGTNKREPKNTTGKCLICGQPLQRESIGAESFGYCPCFTRVQDWRKDY